jgi:hypothetical protein
MRRDWRAATLLEALDAERRIWTLERELPPTGGSHV